jgi:MraZ protein
LIGVTKTGYMFRGTFSATIDPKNRLLVPSKHRAQLTEGLDNGFVANLTPDGKRLMLFPPSYYPKVVAAARAAAVTETDKKFVTYHYSARAVELDFDTQNRILLPGEMLSRAGLGREVMVLGMVNFLELWNAAEYVQTLQEQTTQASVAVTDVHTIMTGLAESDSKALLGNE